MALVTTSTTRTHQPVAVAARWDLLSKATALKAMVLRSKATVPHTKEDTALPSNTERMDRLSNRVDMDPLSNRVGTVRPPCARVVVVVACRDGVQPPRSGVGDTNAALPHTTTGVMVEAAAAAAAGATWTSTD